MNTKNMIKYSHSQRIFLKFILNGIIFYIILSFPHNTAMGLNNVMKTPSINLRIT
jgi:hypothetical protein